ncbi:MAG: hypothetical protein Q4C54_06545 [Clostridia bacterium]|nr:hypothetical protein [Clostridia bacterium]
MEMGTIKLILLIAALPISLMFMVWSIAALSRIQKGQRECTRETTGVLTFGYGTGARNTANGRKVAFVTEDGEQVDVLVPDERLDPSFFCARKDEEVPVWYCPEKPSLAYIGNDPRQYKRETKWMNLRALFICLSIVIAVTGILLPDIPTTPMRELNDTYRALDGKQVTSMTYTIRNMSLFPTTTRQYGPEKAREVLDIILSIEVKDPKLTGKDQFKKAADKRDSYYREFTFRFADGEEVTFRFLYRCHRSTYKYDHSINFYQYFMVDGYYHALGSNRLIKVNEILER